MSYIFKRNPVQALRLTGTQIINTKILYELKPNVLSSSKILDLLVPQKYVTNNSMHVHNIIVADGNMANVKQK